VDVVEDEHEQPPILREGVARDIAKDGRARGLDRQ
jgi:hypothetical protein